MKKRIILPLEDYAQAFERELSARLASVPGFCIDPRAWIIELLIESAKDVTARCIHQRLGIGQINHVETYVDLVARATLIREWGGVALKPVSIWSIIEVLRKNPDHDIAVPHAIARDLPNIEEDWCHNHQVRSQSDAVDYVIELSDALRQLETLERWDSTVSEFADKEPWALWSLEHRGPILLMESLGDYRIIEWEQHFMVNGRYINH